MLIGGRLGEIPSQSYSLLDIPGPRQTLVHVHPGAEELGRVYHPHLAIHAAPTGFAAALEGLQPPNEISWRAQTKAAHDDYLAWTENATPQPGGVNLGEIVVWLRQNLPQDAFITTGAGNFSAWVHRFYRFRKFATHIGPTAGSMGYGVPSALGIEAGVSRAHGGVLLRRRRLPDERPGVRHRRAIRRAVHHRSSPTTAPTAPSACTRSANIRPAWSAPS